MTDISEYFRNLSVAVHQGEPHYSSTPPFNPSKRYAEYDSRLEVSDGDNPAYEGVRSALQLLGLDRANFNTDKWNPLGEIVSPGNVVVIKPNFVLSDHYRGGNLFSVITHPSIIRAVIDYTFKALKGDGKIIIADTPQMDCDFGELLERSNLPAIAKLYMDKFGFEIPIRDLRQFWFKYKDENYVASQENRNKLPGDPEGGVVINLAGKSAFDGVSNTNYYGADYNRDETISHHTGTKQEYMLSKTVLGADVLISIPKLKVHKKVGVTLNAKGLVGTITNKNYLVHYTIGDPEKGGDQFPSGFLKGKVKVIVAVQRYLYDALLARKSRTGTAIFKLFYSPYRRFLKPLLRDTTAKIVLLDGGNWHGNDSAWRMVSDLMKISIYADRNGIMRMTPQRKVFSVIDGIIGGEGNGPLFPDERKAGVVVAGFNHLAVDIVAAKLMGFDWKNLHWVLDLLGNKHFNFFVDNPGNISIYTDNQEFRDALKSDSRFLAFAPHPGWIGHLESSVEGID